MNNKLLIYKIPINNYKKKINFQQKIKKIMKEIQLNIISKFMIKNKTLFKNKDKFKISNLSQMKKIV